MTDLEIRFEKVPVYQQWQDDIRPDAEIRYQVLAFFPRGAVPVIIGHGDTPGETLGMAVRRRGFRINQVIAIAERKTGWVIESGEKKPLDKVTVYGWKAPIFVQPSEDGYPMGSFFLRPVGYGLVIGIL